jgi:ABC-2 type transport system ATP-binding protein
VSSHLLHDLERVGDHLILLAASRTQLCGDIDEILAAHRVLVGPRRNIADAERGLNVIRSTQTTRQTRLLVRLDKPVLDPSWEVTEVGLEDIILAYMGETSSLTVGTLTEMGPAQ